MSGYHWKVITIPRQTHFEEPKTPRVTQECGGTNLLSLLNGLAAQCQRLHLALHRLPLVLLALQRLAKLDLRD